jgi:hypothetical protein
MKSWKEFRETQQMNPYRAEVDEFQAISDSITTAVNQMLTEFGDDHIQSFQQTKPGHFTIRTFVRTYTLVMQ